MSKGEKILFEEKTVWKSNFFSRYLDLCVFHESTNFKMYDAIIDITV